MRVAILDNYHELATMLATPLRASGHEVLTEVIPVDFERVITFRPEVIVVVLYRMNKAFDRPIMSAELDVLGYVPLRSLEQYPILQLIPLLLVGYGLHERDIPRECCRYDGFLAFPKDLRLFPIKVEELGRSGRARRQISPYLCPHCGSRLTHLPRNPDDLFCPRCGTAVALVDGDACIYSPVGFKGPGLPCTRGQLLPPSEPPGPAGPPSPEGET